MQRMIHNAKVDRADGRLEQMRVMMHVWRRFIDAFQDDAPGYLLVTVCGVTVCTVLCESSAASALNYSVGEPSNRFLEAQSCTEC